MKNESLLSIWIEAKQIIEPLCDGLPVLTDEPGDWRVETPSGRPFITLRIQKSHVGLYLLPMYYHPHIRPRSMDAYLKGRVRFDSFEQNRFLLKEFKTLSNELEQ